MDKESQTTETRDTVVQDGPTEVRRQTVSQTAKVDSRVTVSRVIWYIAGVIMTLLAIRFVLLLLGANQSAGFVDFIYAVSGVFAAPFYGIFAQPTFGVSQFDSASILAILIYALIAWGITRLIMINRNEAV